MRTEIDAWPLVCTVRECWILADNLRASVEAPNWTDATLIHALVVESVFVEEGHRREGHCKRLLESLCKDDRFEMIVVEAVQNPALAEALLRWGWDCDPGVMDFYRRRPSGRANRSVELNVC